MRRRFVAALIAAPLLVSACSPQTPAFVSRRARVEGRKVHFVDRGAGDEAMVFVHGWACDTRVWPEAFLRGLSRWRLLLVDMPGHGESDELAEDRYTMDACADAVRAVLDEAGVQRAVLVGHSVGATVARQCWRRFPERVRAIVIIDGTLRSLVPEKFSEDEVIAQLRIPDFEKHRELFLEHNLTPVPERHMELAQAMMRRASRSGMLGSILASIDPAIWKDDRVGVPVFCAMSKHPFWDADYERYVRRLVPRLRWRVYEGVSHFVQNDIPERLALDVSEWVDQDVAR